VLALAHDPEYIAGIQAISLAGGGRLDHVAALEAGFSDEWENKLCDVGDAIGRLLPPHIEKEDEVLFPMAEELLKEEEWAEVRTLWRAAQDAIPR